MEIHTELIQICKRGEKMNSLNNESKDGQRAFPGDFINKIIQGDCLEVMKQIPDNSIDLIVTDPPYGISFQSAWRIESERFDRLENDDKIDPTFLMEAFRVVNEGGAVYIFTRWDVYVKWFEATKTAGFDVTNCIVWDRMMHGMGDLQGAYAYQHDFIIYATKGKHILRGKRPKDILRVCRPHPNEIVHPTQKPVELLQKLIEKSSDQDDLVLDPFLGSGTTAVACKQLNRKFIGIELNPDYCKIAEQRVKAIPERLERWIK